MIVLIILNNNNNILYLDTLSREETLFKCVYIGTIIYKLRTLSTMIGDSNIRINKVHTVAVLKLFKIRIKILKK